MLSFTEPERYRADLRSGRGGGMGEHSSRTGYLSGNGSDGLWILPKIRSRIRWMVLLVVYRSMSPQRT